MFLLHLNVNNKLTNTNNPNKKNNNILWTNRTIAPDRIISLGSPLSSGRPQKNWAPFTYQDKLFFVYSINPHVILQCSNEVVFNDNDPRNPNNTTILDCPCTTAYITQNTNVSSDLRGGSQVLMYPLVDKVTGTTEMVYGAFVHIKRYIYNHTMYYTTVFYIFDTYPPFAVRGVSSEFIFDRIDGIKLFNTSTRHIPKYPNIQFVSGFEMTRNSQGELLFHITYGQDDCSSQLCVAPARIFENMLQYVQ